MSATTICRLALLVLCLVGSPLMGQSKPDRSASTSEPKNVKTKKASADESKFDHFVRVRRDVKRKPIAMETSVVRYEGKNNKGERITVDLIGAVHVGEREYYQQLNEQFKKYDAVLYELVAPEGTVVPEGGRGEEVGLNPIAALQKGMQSILKLQFQLDHINYTVDNFIHADMSPTEFSESMERNEESFFGMFMKAVGQSFAMSASSSFSDYDLMMAMLSGDTKKLRQIMAEQMQNLESGMFIFEGKDGSTMINHRNDKALSILERELATGKKELAIFYGAGHLPDFEEKLLSRFGLRRGGQFWLTAWELK